MLVNINSMEFKLLAVVVAFSFGNAIYADAYRGSACGKGNTNDRIRFRNYAWGKFWRVSVMKSKLSGFEIMLLAIGMVGRYFLFYRGYRG